MSINPIIIQNNPIYKSTIIGCSTLRKWVCLKFRGHHLNTLFLYMIKVGQILVGWLQLFGSSLFVDNPLNSNIPITILASNSHLLMCKFTLYMSQFTIFTGQFHNFCWFILDFLRETILHLWWIFHFSGILHFLRVPSLNGWWLWVFPYNLGGRKNIFFPTNDLHFL